MNFNPLDFFTTNETIAIVLALILMFYLIDRSKGKKVYPILKKKGVSNYEHYMNWVESLDEKQKAVEMAKLNRTVKQLEKFLG